MKIRTSLGVVNAAIVVLLCSIIAVSLLFFYNQKKLVEAQEMRYWSYLAADELRQSSDDLTRLARTYVITGDDRYEKMYMDVVDIRAGKKPRPKDYHKIYWDLVVNYGDAPRGNGETKALDQIMIDLGFTEAEFAKLHEAEMNSDKLVQTEVIAMNAVKGLFADESGKFTVNRSPDMKMAADLMHNIDYHKEKAKIMAPINDFLDMIDRRTSDEVQKYIDRGDRYLTALIAMATLVVLLSIASFAIFLAKVGHPLKVITGLLAKGERDLTVKFPSLSQDEIGEMARFFNGFVEQARGLVQRVAQAAHEVGGTAEELSALAEESNAGVEESRAGVDDVSSQMDNLAAATQEITASVEEVASGAQATAQRSTEMAQEVEQARLAGEEGVAAVGKAVASIRKVAADGEESAREVRELGSRAREIQNFVTQIGGIADQTNLLALNAAIEAARAGEAGRGFAVVAEEVRKLAEESNEAAKKIAELASTITKDLDKVVTSSEANAKDSHDSSKLAEETGTTIDRMMAALAKIASATQDLAAVSEEQAASSEEIATAVQNIASRVNTSASSADNVRDQMAEVGASAERVAQGSEKLAGFAVDLRQLVAAFKYDAAEAPGGAPLVPLGGGKGDLRRTRRPLRRA